MSAIILNGKEIAVKLREKLKSEVLDEKKQSGRDIRLSTIRIGSFEDAQLYQNAIDRLLKKFEIEHDAIHIDEGTVENQVIDLIHEKANDDSITGILLLSPIPKSMSYSRLLRSVHPDQDAEGTRYASEGNFEGVYPPTALAIIELILATGIPIEGKNAVVVGRSSIVGRPAADLLIKHNATVTICHSKTRDLNAHVMRSDIVVAATGRANLIQGDWIKEGAIVIDAGENVIDGKPVGDIDFDNAQKKAGWITPVPSGVGPITSLMLVRNLLALSRRRQPIS